jgi:uncharacterized protein YjiS (DUF1127 family)
MAISTFKSRKPFLAIVAFERLAIFIETLPDRMVEQFYIWQRRTIDRHHLRQLNDRTLVDIGLDRADIVREAKKPFWQA